MHLLYLYLYSIYILYMCFVLNSVHEYINLPTKVKRSMCGRTQQILPRLSLIFPQSLTGEKETSVNHERPVLQNTKHNKQGSLTRHRLVSCVLVNRRRPILGLADHRGCGGCVDVGQNASCDSLQRNSSVYHFKMEYN